MAKFMAVLLTAASVLVLAILATRETGAMWHDAESLGAATISSGTLVLTADGAHSVTLESLSGTAMQPGDTRQMSFLLANEGTTPLTYQLGSAIVAGSTPTGLLLSASRMTSGAAATDCDDTLVLPPTELLVNATPIPLAPESSDRICLRAEVSPTAESGSTFTATFTFNGQQA
jgi:hypothetical protein